MTRIAFFRPGGAAFRAALLLAWPAILAAAPGAVEPGAASAATPGTSLRVLDLSGRPVDPLACGDAKAVVFLFVSVDCPISNSYAPEYRRLQADFRSRKALFRLVYPNRDESAEAVKKHLKDFDLPLTAWRDPGLQLTRAAGATVTPEAAVFVPGEGFVYHGRIDNRTPELGISRPEATTHDLRDALAAVLSGKPAPRKSAPAIGCYIANLK